jgi:hypothetical protein
VARLIQFVPSFLRARAQQDFASWNSRLRDGPRVFAEKYIKAQDTKARQTALAGAYQDQKALAFDKLALFERNGLGRFFFAPGAKTMNARVQYLHQSFQKIEALQGSSGAKSAFASLFPSTSAYLASIGAEWSELGRRLSGTLVDCAYAEQSGPPASRPRECQRGAEVCDGALVQALPIRPANSGPDVYRVMLEGTLLGCKDEPIRGAEGLFSVYEIAETHYVCANGKNVTAAPTRVLMGKVYVGGVACQDGSMAFRNIGIYTFESGIEDGPIPDGCVGINKVRKQNTPSEELTQSSKVLLNAAPCWEKRWQCQYREDPLAVVADTKLMRVPDAPQCPS